MTTTAAPFTQVPSAIVKVLIACDDSFTENTLWHIDRLDQRSATLDGRAYRGQRGTGAVIYIIDTGVMAAHDEFMTATGSRVIAGFDLVHLAVNPCSSPDRTLEPCGQSPATLSANSHGTGVASAAAGKNVGVAPNASIVAIRFGEQEHNPTLKDFSDALDTVIAHAFSPQAPPFSTGIVNLSFGFTNEVEGVTYAGVTEKIRRMTQGVDANGNPAANGKRFFFTFAAGNVFATTCDAGGPTKVYPATIGSQIDGAVTVGGTTRNDTIWSGSCRGAELYAPAEELLVAISSATNHYRAGPNFFPNSGTSWSAPIVAGIAARFLETNPSLTPPQLEARLLASAVPIGTTGERIPLFLPPPARQRSVRH